MWGCACTDYLKSFMVEVGRDEAKGKRHCWHRFCIVGNKLEILKPNARSNHDGDEKNL